METARTLWDEVIELGEAHGYRNAQATVLAPTGTIGFMMDCDTTGIEPDIALVKYKKLVGGGLMKIVNQTVPMALQKLGYSAQQVKEIVEYIDENETIEGAPHVKDAHLPVFDCAFKPAAACGRSTTWGTSRWSAPRSRSCRARSARPSTCRRTPPSRRSSRPTSMRGASAPRPCRSTATEQAHAAAQHVARQGQGVRGARRRRGSAPPAAARRAPRDHAQVRHRRARGLHHGRPLRGRPAG
jgi:ribonucleotide reductase alpha subunit